jgi:hypothetical protein
MIAAILALVLRGRMPSSSPGETTEAGPLWVFDNFGEVKEMGSPPFMAEIARYLGERYEPSWADWSASEPAAAGQRQQAHSWRIGS